jgi:3-hydroxyacyl-CoA dehydrogenase
LYAANRIPEIADHLYSIDDAMRAGFAWDYGPFQYWDIIGLEKGIKAIEEAGYSLPEWILTMRDKGFSSFYSTDNGQVSFYDIQSSSYVPVPISTDCSVWFISKEKIVYKNDEVRLWDIGDDVLCLEFYFQDECNWCRNLTKGSDTIGIAEEGSWRGLVIGNNSKILR